MKDEKPKNPKEPRVFILYTGEMVIRDTQVRFLPPVLLPDSSVTEPWILLGDCGLRRFTGDGLEAQNFKRATCFLII